MSDEADDTASDTPELPLSGEQDSAVDPNRIRRKKQKLLSADQQSDAFWGRVFADPVGRREMWTLLNKLHPFDVQMGLTPVGFTDERRTWMELAVQLSGQQIYQDWFTRFPEEVSLMRSENDPRFQKVKGA